MSIECRYHYISVDVQYTAVYMGWNVSLLSSDKWHKIEALKIVCDHNSPNPNMLRIFTGHLYCCLSLSVSEYLFKTHKKQYHSWNL